MIEQSTLANKLGAQILEVGLKKLLHNVLEEAGCSSCIGTEINDHHKRQYEHADNNIRIHAVIPGRAVG
jgi:hypothetical protein